MPTFQILVLDPNSRAMREVLRGKFVNVWGLGANVLKPLFVTGCAITAVGFVFSLAFMRMSPFSSWYISLAGELIANFANFFLKKL